MITFASTWRVWVSTLLLYGLKPKLACPKHYFTYWGVSCALPLLYTLLCHHQGLQYHYKVLNWLTLLAQVFQVNQGYRCVLCNTNHLVQNIFDQHLQHSSDFLSFEQSKLLTCFMLTPTLHGLFQIKMPFIARLKTTNSVSGMPLNLLCVIGLADSNCHNNPWGT